MADFKKLLSRFNKKERSVIELLIAKIISLDWGNLNIKKLKGYKDFFRVRKGKIRIIYQLTEDKEIYILAIERRSDKTYKDF